jgi:hypothetical protein
MALNNEHNVSVVGIVVFLRYLVQLDSVHEGTLNE